MGYRYTPADLKTLQDRTAPTGKYKNKKVVIDNIGFDSKREAARYNELKLMQNAGLINDLKCHPEYKIAVNDVDICTVILDFRYFDLKKGLMFIEDVKGKDNDFSRLKRKLVEAMYDMKVTLVK